MEKQPSRRDFLKGALKGAAVLGAASMMPGESEAADKKLEVNSLSAERNAEIKKETDVISGMQEKMAVAYKSGNKEEAQKIGLELQAQIDKVLQMLK